LQSNVSPLNQPVNRLPNEKGGLGLGPKLFIETYSWINLPQAAGEAHRIATAIKVATIRIANGVIAAGIVTKIVTGIAAVLPENPDPNKKTVWERKFCGFSVLEKRATPENQRGTDQQEAAQRAAEKTVARRKLRSLLRLGFISAISITR